MLTALQQDMLVRAQARNEALASYLACNWLRVNYRRLLYGGYTKEDGQVAKPHAKAIGFHDAAARPEIKTLVIAGGRRSAKTFTGMSEFCSWPLGERPWNGTKTAEPMAGRRWLIVAPNFSTAIPDVIEPYLELRLGHMIVDRIRNQQKALVTAVLKNGDTIRLNSYEQYLKAGREQTHVFQSGHFDGVLCDEPPPREVWLGIKRGLVTGESRGWGKAIICGTPDQEAFGWIFDELYSRAGNLGGDDPTIWATDFSIYDNPGNSSDAIDRLRSGLSEEEQEAIIYGRFRHIVGRVYKTFNERLHVQSWDPLVLPNGEASSWPIIMVCDPAARRPWAFVWLALDPEGGLHVVDEWPRTNFEAMRTCAMSYEDYANVIRDVELTFPTLDSSGHELEGGRRVLWRIMDPNSGPSRSPGGGDLSHAEAMGKLGFAFDTEVEDSIPVGHQTVRGLLNLPDSDQPPSALNRPMLFVHSTPDRPCRNVIWSFLHYVYDAVQEGRLAKEDPLPAGKDHMDCIRYAAMRAPRYVNWREVGSRARASHGSVIERARRSRWR